MGLLTARRGAGFFVAETGRGLNLPGMRPEDHHARHRRQLAAAQHLEHREGGIQAGCGWLPESWHDLEEVRKGLRHLALSPHGMVRYGPPKGYEPLREQVTRQLAELEIDAAPAQVLLTHGASQGLDLVVRRLTREGDTVLVDDPGYSNLLLALRLRGLQLVGVPMTPTGPTWPSWRTC